MRAGVAVAGIAAGIALRAWTLSSPVLGVLDSDEAVKGLMARHALHGEFSVFFWLQTYAGSLEALVTAPFFAVFGSSTLVLKLVGTAFYALSAIVVWRIGVRVLGEPRATYAGVLFWIAPAFLVWYSTKAYFYGSAILCGLLALLLVLRLDERSTLVDWAALGLVLGIGWWITPAIALTAAPALGWLAVRAPTAWRRAKPAVPAFLVGASPWLAWNARNGWLSLHVDRGAVVAHESYARRLVDVFRYTLPTWLGVRVPYSLDWLLGRAVGVALVALALAGLVWGIRRRTRPVEPLLLVAVAFPFLDALSPFSSFVKEPRYLAVVGGVIALLLARPLRSPVVAAAGLAAALALSVAGLAVMERQKHVQFGIGTAKIPADLSPLLRLLEREHATHVIANYWLAYRIDFESRERIVATSSGFVRYAKYDREVHADPHPAYAFLRGTAEERAARRRLRGYRRLSAGTFVVDVHRPRASTKAAAATVTSASGQ